MAPPWPPVLPPSFAHLGYDYPGITKRVQDNWRPQFPFATLGDIFTVLGIRTRTSLGREHYSAYQPRKAKFRDSEAVPTSASTGQGHAWCVLSLLVWGSPSRGQGRWACACVGALPVDSVLFFRGNVGTEQKCTTWCVRHCPSCEWHERWGAATLVDLAVWSGTTSSESWWTSLCNTLWSSIISVRLMETSLRGGWCYIIFLGVSSKDLYSEP